MLYTKDSLGSHDIGQNIKIEDHILAQINMFKYLGFSVADNNRLNAE